MAPSHNELQEENRRLRATMRDLVALSTLPAIWINLEPDGIARSLADVLMSTLPLDLLYIRLGNPLEDDAVEVFRSAAARDDEAIRSLIAPVLEMDSSKGGATLDDPSSGETLRVAVTRFGAGHVDSVIVSASRHVDFPSDRDRVLLGVGANQTSIVIQRRRAQRRVQQSEARKSAILETALDCIISMDHVGRVVEFNPAAERMFGYARSDVVGRELAELIIPERDRESHRKGLARYLASGEGPVLGRRIELSALHASGREFPVELTITTTRTDRPPLFTAYLRDITQRVRHDAQRNLRLTATQVLARATSVTGAVGEVLRVVCQELGWEVGFFWTYDPSTDALHCSESWHAARSQAEGFEVASRERTFRRGEGLPGRAWDSGEPAWLLDVTAADNFPRGEPATDEGLRGAFACPVAVGDEFFGVIEFFSREIERPDPDLLETVATIAGLMAQFLERKQAEAAVRHSEARFRGLMEEAPFSIQVFAPDGRAVRANRAWEELWGTKFEDAQGYNILEDSQLERRGVLEYIERGFAGEVTNIPAIEYDPEETLPGVTRHEDARRWLSAVIYPITDDAGEVREVVLVHEDITARKLAEDELRIRVEQLAEAGRHKEELLASLRETDRRKDEFLATLAHELRNPLAPVKNSLQILKMKRIDSELAQQKVEVMERQIDQLVRLVDDLLDVSRVMRGKIALRKEPVELASILARAVETAQPLIDAQRHAFEVDLPDDSLLVEADPVRLSQVVSNLLMNAAKYTDAGGHITLTAGREGEQALLRVRDDGIGIAADVLPHVFDLFVQADHSTKRAEGGLGLGLTLVKNLVDLHDGTVEVSSAGLGEGAEFTVRLPLLDLVERPDEPREQPQADRAASGLRLLVVDDNEDAAETLGMLLELLGHEAKVVHDGRSALEVVTEFRPALVLLDLGMPVMDGYEVAQRIRSTPGVEDTMLVALTGWGQADDRRRTEEAGFDHHLVKPLQTEALEEILTDLIRTRSSARRSSSPES